MTSSIYKASFWVTSALLFLAIAQMPWGYYQTLRWLVPIAGVLVIMSAVKFERRAWIVLGVLSIIFFFPLFGVYLDKATWAYFDAAFGISYIFAAIRLAK